MTDQTLKMQAEELIATLPKLNRSISVLYVDDPAIDLPVAQLRVCSILRDGPRAMSCLSRELGISLSATTQLADRLERAGMVERVAETDDRRVKSLQLTMLGSEVMQTRIDRRVLRAEKVLLHLPPESREDVLNALKTLLHACRETTRLGTSPDDVSTIERAENDA